MNVSEKLAASAEIIAPAYEAHMFPMRKHAIRRGSQRILDAAKLGLSCASTLLICNFAPLQFADLPHFPFLAAGLMEQTMPSIKGAAERLAARGGIYFYSVLCKVKP